MKYERKFGRFEIAQGRLTRDDPTDWTSRVIRGSEKGTVTRLWFVAISLTVFLGVWMWCAHMPLMFTKNVPNPFLCIIGFIGFCHFIKAVWETLRLRRFGDPVLELSAAPVPPGGNLDGRLTITSGVERAPEFTLTVACIHRIETGSGKNAHFTEKVLWSEEKKASLLPGGILPVSFAVPMGQPPTNKCDPRDAILWRLTVRAPFRGQAFIEKYELPIGSVAAAVRQDEGD